MTHDELLALLTVKSDSDEVHALRAIVELHKPIGTYCEACIQSGIEHPCPTIQAIEKELR